MDSGQTAFRILDSLSGIAPQEWNALARCGGELQPTLRHEFLHALHETGCAAGDSGWLPQYLTLWHGSRLAAAMPLYVKNHSYGEYVFDWAWADAYQRAGLDYYPKLLSAIPFTPVSGPRLLGADAADRQALARHAIELAQQVSSLHVLFPALEDGRLLREAGMLLRDGVQFHWDNPGYASFEQFLGELSASKRKKIRQERRRVADTGVRWQRLSGKDIGEEHWAFFNRCYRNTYREHHSSPYLDLPFFLRLGETMPENLLLVIARLDGQPVASSLNLINDSTLYGRYWGCTTHIPLLHFEACYYQTQEFCIERGIRTFEGGAQGEHKMARGFRPVQTVSAHWLAHPQFADAVKHFLGRETAGMEQYLDELNERTPFRRTSP